MLKTMIKGLTCLMKGLQGYGRNSYVALSAEIKNPQNLKSKPQ